MQTQQALALSQAAETRHAADGAKAAAEVSVAPQDSQPLPPLRAHRLPVCWQARNMNAQNWRLRADALLQQPGMGNHLSVDQHIALRLGPQPGMHSDALPAPAAQLQLPAPGAQLLLPAPGAQLQLQAPGEAQDGDEAPLPLGWSKAQDNSGRWYYHPSDWSGPAQWERPDARNVRQRLA